MSTKNYSAATVRDFLLHGPVGAHYDQQVFADPDVDPDGAVAGRRLTRRRNGDPQRHGPAAVFLPDCRGENLRGAPADVPP
jgi:hypothetical protein